MLDDAKLRIFKAVAEEGGFTKAAYRLGVSQPAVSQSIAELEKSTGKALVTRLHNRTELSDEGRILYAHAVGILDDYDALNHAMEWNDVIQKTGILNLGISTPALGRVISGIIPYLRQINPRMEIRITDEGQTCDVRIFMDGQQIQVEDGSTLSPSPFTNIIRNRLKP